METLFRIILFLTGAINLLPALLAFLPQRIAQSYGIEIPNVNFELLLRHRAILFGIVGGLMLYAAITQKYYALAVTTGLVSMVSFLVLYFSLEGVNAELEKVMKIDFAAVILLIVGYLLYYFRS